MATNDDRNAAALLIEQVEAALKEPGNDQAKLRRALSLAAEANRTSDSTHRAELLRDARQLIRRATEG